MALGNYDKEHAIVTWERPEIGVLNSDMMCALSVKEARPFPFFNLEGFFLALLACLALEARLAFYI